MALQTVPPIGPVISQFPMVTLASIVELLARVVNLFGQPFRVGIAKRIGASCAGHWLVINYFPQ